MDFGDSDRPGTESPGDFFSTFLGVPPPLALLVLVLSAVALLAMVALLTRTRQMVGRVILGFGILLCSVWTLLWFLVLLGGLA